MEPMSAVPLLSNSSDDEEELDFGRRYHGYQQKMDTMSNSSDEEDSECNLARRVCCPSAYRWFCNDKDTSFTPGEIRLFDQMAKSYNLANFKEINTVLAKSPETCLFHYFLANSEIVQGKWRAGKRYVKQGLQVAKQFPRKHNLYFLLLASPNARVFYMKDDIDGLHHLLDICFQKVEALGRGGVPGSVLGWLFYMRARSHKNDKSAAIADFELAIDAFKLSNTSDKDFGVAHTLCRLIICILGCGERADIIDDVETSFPEEMRRVKSLFKEIDEMEVVQHSLVIRIIYLMAETDYNFRTRNTSLTLQRAREAYELAVSSKCEEFLEVTKERLDVYTKKINGGGSVNEEDCEQEEKEQQEQEGQGQEHKQEEHKQDIEKEKERDQEQQQEQRERPTVNQNQPSDVPHHTYV